MILAGDIGGTKTVLAIFEEQQGALAPVREAVFPSQEHPTFEEILRKFLDGETSGFAAGTFGVAGAVINGQVQTTNLPWHLDEESLAKTIGARRVKLLNDLEAAAYGMLFLGPDERKTLNEGQSDRKGNIAVIAAGTGLGEAILHWDGEQYHPLASEGGHSDFAPRNAVEIELLEYLQEQFPDHVSYERVLSGPGFFNIYSFLRAAGYASEPAWLAKDMTTRNPNVAISQAALERQDPLCLATVDLFLSIYGAEAGNLALKCLGVGGVYIGGGIAPKLLPFFETGSFLRGFTEKGRFAPTMEAIPVNVALNPRTPVIGAANYALRL